MKTAYFGISMSNRLDFDNEINILKELLSKKGIKLLVFVDEYKFNKDEEKEMMKAAFDEIDKSEFMIAELTKKAIGVGVEVGYAYAKGKYIIYIRRKESSYSTTIAGSSHSIIEYIDTTHLAKEIESVIKKLIL